MKLLEFLKETDQAADRLTKEQLLQWIHDLARRLPEEERDLFLARLKNSGKDEPGSAEEEMDLSDAIVNCKEKLKNIEQGKWYLDSTIMEDYDDKDDWDEDWYDADETDYAFDDPYGAINAIEDACRLIHTLLEAENYKAASEIAVLLVDLEVNVKGAYYECVNDVVTMDEFSDRGISELDFEGFMTDAAYAAYCTNALPETEAFIRQWILFLGGESSWISTDLLIEALGWSYTFMKKGLALYLLLLYQGTDLKGKGCLRMCKMAAEGAEFRAEAYEKGLLKKTEGSNEELFWQCFCRWKETVSLTEEDWQKYLYWVEQLIKKRVRGIMEANRRNYYEECAAFVAALGEVTQSKGNPQAAQQVMLDYKQMYARRSAFHRELKAFGMKS